MTEPTALDLPGFRAIAERATDLGAAIVARSAPPRIGPGDTKGLGDYVTTVDRESEQAMRDFLMQATPEVPVVGEEAGGTREDVFWAVDPLDGTTNFLIGFPVVAVSAAVVSQGRVMVGSVRAPFLGLAFSAARGQGAWSGTQRLQVSGRPADRAIVATALPFRARSLLPRYMPVLEEVFERTEDIRRPGSAELDLAWVASGVFDGYFELNLGVWDVAAGALLVEEAGGVVTDWDGGDGYLETGNILAASPSTHRVLLAAARATSHAKMG